MVKRKNSSGLIYRKIDLHLHTPASDCFPDKSITPEDIVNKSIKEGLDAIAITDHNSGAWVDDIKKAAKNKLTVFPGVEITTAAGERNIHVVAIFDIGKSSKDIENLLGELKIYPDKYGQRDAYTNYSPSDVIDIIAARGALAIAPHANSSNGIMGGMKGNPRYGVVNNTNLASVEATEGDFNSTVKKQKGTRVIDLLDGSHTEYRKLAVYQVSDNLDEKTGNHDINKIGSRYSHFKLDEINLEGLRQCFCDPDVRIRQKSDFYIAKLPKLIQMDISQGFLSNQKVRFHEGLNSIVGGKGTGKSLIIEFIRFALNQNSHDKDILKDHNNKLEKRLEPFGQITVYFELPTGDKYKITRTYDNSVNTIDCTNCQTDELYQGDVPTLFPILAYSQNEVIKISEDEAAQLRLIDSFLDTSSYEEKYRSLRAELKKNDRELSNSIKASYELASYKTQLSTIEEELKTINKALKNKLFDEMKLLEQKKLLLEQYLTFHQTIESKLDETLQYFNSDLAIPIIPKEFTGDVDIKQANNLAKESVNILSKLITQAKNKTQIYSKKIKELHDIWIPQFEKKKKQYEDMLTKAGGDKRKLESRRRKLSEQKETLELELDKYTKQMEKLNEIRKNRDSLLDEFDKAHKSYFDTRKRIFDELTSQSRGKLKLDISFAANRDDFKENLWNLRARSGIHRTDTDRAADNLMPREFVDLVIDNKIEELSSKTGLALLNADKLIQVLNSSEDLADVLALSHSVYPEDVPSIQYKKDDGNYYPISEVSTGQKCTALLIIALSEGTKPIIIDQPEDSLDTTSVYEDIVMKLRDGKEKRQFILTTHNASVGVASDSDNFIVLKSTSSRGKIDCYGAIDKENVKSEVVQHLEGGPLPYSLRHKKYHIKI